MLSCMSVKGKHKPRERNITCKEGEIVLRKKDMKKLVRKKKCDAKVYRRVDGAEWVDKVWKTVCKKGEANVQS